jgi:hypothetical protein
MNPTTKIYTTFFAFCLTISSASNAIGWGDYELDIGDGYSIVKCNSDDINVSRKGHGIILFSMDYNDIGPVDTYYATKQFVFTKNLGRKKRNLFQGDTLEEADVSNNFYFIISKGDDKVIGPLSEFEFKNHPNVTNTSSIRWRRPHNPLIWLPFYGLFVIPGIGIAVGLSAAVILLWHRNRSAAMTLPSS